MSSPTPDDIFGAEGLSEYIARKEASWEDIAVRKALDGLGLQTAPYLRRRAAEWSGGSPHLTMAIFDQVYPDFPFTLMARRPPYVHELTLQNLEQSFTRSQLYIAYEECLEQAAVGRPVVMIFPWPHFGVMAMHDQPPDLETPGFFFGRVLASGPVVIDTVKRFMAGVRRKWEPQSDYGG